MGKKQITLLIITGAITGFCNGFFGGGGGMIVVPMLVLLLKLSPKKAHATAILIILPISVISAVISIINGHYDFAVGIPSGIGVVAGGIVGALALKKIDNKVLVKAFAFVMLIAGVRLLFF